MQMVTQGPLTEDEVLAQFADDDVWFLLITGKYLPILTPVPGFPELEMLNFFVERGIAEMALQHMKAVRPDISKDLIVQTAKLHGCVRLYVKHSRAPGKLRFMIHSTAPQGYSPSGRAVPTR